MLVENVPSGVKLVAVCDCCHSGTIMDLPFTYKPEGEKGQAGQQSVSYTAGGGSKDGGGLGIPGPILIAIAAVAVPIMLFAFSKLFK